MFRYHKHYFHNQQYDVSDLMVGARIDAIIVVFSILAGPNGLMFRSIIFCVAKLFPASVIPETFTLDDLLNN